MFKRLLKSVIVTLLLLFLTVPVNAGICVLEEVRLNRTLIQRLCIDNYEWILAAHNAFGSISLQQSLKDPFHAYGGTNPKTCRCPEPIIPKKHFWER